VAENIKKGWDLHSSQTFEVAAPAETIVAPQASAVEAVTIVEEAVLITADAAEPPAKPGKKKAAPKLASSESTRKPKATKKKSG
jgi:hypothetical protein